MQYVYRWSNNKAYRQSNLRSSKKQAHGEVVVKAYSYCMRMHLTIFINTQTTILLHKKTYGSEFHIGHYWAILQKFNRRHRGLISNKPEKARRTCQKTC